MIRPACKAPTTLAESPNAGKNHLWVVQDIFGSPQILVPDDRVPVIAQVQPSWDSRTNLFPLRIGRVNDLCEVVVAHQEGLILVHMLMIELKSLLRKVTVECDCMIQA